MATWAYDPETITRNVDWPTLTSTFENESEQRRLKVKKKVITWQYKSPPLTSTQYAAHLAFWNAHNGGLTAFDFADDSDGLTYSVRFVAGSWQETYSGGTWRVSFSMRNLDQGS